MNFQIQSALMLAGDIESNPGPKLQTSGKS